MPARSTCRGRAVPGAGYYRLYRATGSGQATQIHAGPGLAYMDTGLTANTAYHYTLAACTDSTESTLLARSAAVVATPATSVGLSAPSNLRATVMDSFVDLAWDRVMGATRYEVWRGIQANGVDRTRITGVNGQPADPTTMSYRDTIAARTTVHYWLKACTGGRVLDFTASSLEVTTAWVALNDTGITTCTGSLPQDCTQGRDAAAAADTLPKVGNGGAGFDFTKLGSDGTVLAKQNVAWSNSGSEAAGSKWACVRDNHTGLVWEVKDDSGGIHDKDDGDRWGGLTALGRDSDSTGKGTYHDDGMVWSTGATVPACAVAVTGGHRPLRSFPPSPFMGREPAIAGGYFPNTTIRWYWSATSPTRRIIPRRWHLIATARFSLMCVLLRTRSFW